jgi:hypothetical protein
MGVLLLLENCWDAPIINKPVVIELNIVTNIYNKPISKIATNPISECIAAKDHLKV